MSQFMSRDLESMLSALGKAWGWLLGFGIISVVAGLAAIFWPGGALLAVALIFGAYLVVGGVFRFIAAFAIPGESGWVRALMAILALISFVVGLYLLRHPVYTILIVALLLGLYWMVHGIIDLFAAIGHPKMPGRGWTIASGILSIVAGAIVFFYPNISLVVLSIVLGFWLILYGVILIVSAFRLRSAARRLHPLVRPFSST
jgi:uncharacterized membrane protein HdeD (DUF308 family)